LRNVVTRIKNRLKKWAGKDIAPASTVQFDRLYLSTVGQSLGNGGFGVIFSMDRAFQLHALLSSYFEKVKDPVRLQVIYRATSNAHMAAYREVFSLFKDRGVVPVLQRTKEAFRLLVIRLLEESVADWVFFLVDDIIFIDDVALSELSQYDLRDFVPSLRLGTHLSRCFTMNQNQSLPTWVRDRRVRAGHLAWNWSEGDLDWAYPISVDGHFFNRKEFLELSRQTDFVSPTTYEGHIQKFLPYFKHRTGVCFEHAKIVNLAVNKVQTENQNLHGDVHQDELLESWHKGQQMDFRKFYGISNESAHITRPIPFTPRE
jgi:hypothetical protein